MFIVSFTITIFQIVNVLKIRNSFGVRFQKIQEELDILRQIEEKNIMYLSLVESLSVSIVDHQIKVKMIELAMLNDAITALLLEHEFTFDEVDELLMQTRKVHEFAFKFMNNS